MMSLFVAAILLPLLASVVAACLIPYPSMRRAAALSSVIGLILSSLCALTALALFEGVTERFIVTNWIESGELKVSWAFYADSLSVIMVALVSTISALIHIYALDYMKDDKSIARFFCFLSLFTYAMLILVSADNLLMLFFGWEGVGLCSYLLIGFWHEKRSAALAAVKAFIYNRVGDAAFVIGMVALAVMAGGLQWDTLATAFGTSHNDIVLLGVTIPLLPLVALLLLVGAMAKSAQWLLHGWLPDAMEGPTPVSALIHAATMVTAGVFLILRLQPLFVIHPIVQDTILVVGGITALFAAINAAAQNDIKRVIAWSTCSQIGYMFLALGVAAWGAALFHLVTHAFFKALLFLAAGSVIHALHGEQDMRRMAGLKNSMPLTCAAMTIGALALMGMPFLSGFYSKEAILESLWIAQRPMAHLAWMMGLCAALLTAFYATRLVLMPFFTPQSQRGKLSHQPHEASIIMIIPMTILAIGAVFIGFLTHDEFIHHGDHTPSAFIRFLPLGFALCGGLSALFFFIAKPPSVAWAHKVAFFFRSGWRMDRFYHILLGRNVMGLAHSCEAAEKEIIDGMGPDGIASFIGKSSAITERWQRGGIVLYSFFLVLFVTLLLAWYGLTLIEVGEL